MKPRVVLLMITCLFLGPGCDKETKPPPPLQNVAQVVPPRQIVGFGPDLSFRFFRWDNGLNLLLVDDIEQGNREHESSMGPADSPVRRHRGSASTADGRAYAWQLETTDERTGKLAIERQEYDLAKGMLFVVKTQGNTVRVLQLDRPLADVPFDVNGCREYLQKQAEVLAFLETFGLRIQELESEENLLMLAGHTACAFKYSGCPVQFWVELDSGDRQQRALAVPDWARLPGPKQVVEGYFIWVRGEANDAGQEIWRLGFSSCRRSPLVQAQGTQSKRTAGTSRSRLDWPVQIWKGKVESIAARISARKLNVTTSITTPVPMDREVCLKTITDESGSPGQEGYEHHVIRVMCKAMPDEEEAVPDEETAKEMPTSATRE